MVEKHSIAVVGAGLVGSGWALVFARAGFRVRVYDGAGAVRSAFMPWAAQSVKELVDSGLASDANAILARLSVHDELEVALKGGTYIQESVFETVEAKTEVSLAIDRLMAPEAVVGSSSSGIPASKFTATCKNRSRFLIAHPVNPPHLVPVVELVPAPWTAPDVVASTRDLMASIGQVPVSLTREVDGFILNRLQGALLNEAWALYREGYASLADIDATVAHGLGLRWSFMGPFETIDLNAPGGIADYAKRLGPMYSAMVRNPPPQEWPSETVERAELERRAQLPAVDLAARRQWRDTILGRLAAFRRANDLQSQLAPQAFGPVFNEGNEQ